MLALHHVSKLFLDTVVLDDCSFVLRAGERAALVGANGAGKSTLLRIAVGGLEPESGTVVLDKDARAAYLPQDAAVAPGRTLHQEMASVFGRVGAIEARLAALAEQMEHAAGDDARLATLVDEQAALHGDYDRLDGYAIDARIGRVLAGLGFAEDDWHRPTEQLSGGWQMRAALAKLLLEQPDVLLLDEPTNHLDVAATEWLEEYLVGSRLAVLVVSHDRYFLDRVTRRTLELRDRRLTDFPMSYSQYAVERARRDESQLGDHRRQKEYLARQQAYIERFRASPTRHTLVQSREKMLARIERIDKPTRDSRIAFRFASAQASGREVFNLEGVRKSYGATEVFSGVDLLIQRGERIGLVGPNGSGKSTLLRLLARVEKPDRGHLTQGHNVQTVFYSQTQAESLDSSHTALEEVREVARTGTTELELRSLLGQFLISQEDVDKKVAVLSGGERSRLALAKLLLRSANLLLLDEPTNHFDIASREVLEAALRAYTGTAVIASHDRYLLDRVATRIVEVGDGKLVGYDGGYTRYRQRKAGAETVARASVVLRPNIVADPPRPKVVAATPPPAPMRRFHADDERRRLEKERRAIQRRLLDPALWSNAVAAAEVVEALSRVQSQIESLTPA